MYGVWTYCPTCHQEIAACCSDHLDVKWRAHQKEHAESRALKETADLSI